jgi:hypothetical protein
MGAHLSKNGSAALNEPPPMSLLSEWRPEAASHLIVSNRYARSGPHAAAGWQRLFF